MIRLAGQDPDISRLVVSVMNEQLQGLTPSADRPIGRLQVPAPAGAHTVCGELSAIIRSDPGRKVACEDATGIRRSRNEFSRHDGKEAFPHRVTWQLPAEARHRPRRCRDLTPKTTESHWSGGQREP